jgi:pimeloyl-ACP methyl ester carboxylesterase
MQIARANGVTLAFRDEGLARDTLVLIHGHPFDSSMWEPQLHVGCRVVAPDLRGYGQSEVVPRKTTLDVFARDIAALLDSLGCNRVIVGGLSMGGQIAMEFCRLFPDRVRGLLLAATFPAAESAQGKVQRNATADRLLREGMGPYAEETLHRMVAAKHIDTVGRRVLDMMRAAPPAGAAAALRGRAERPDYEATLAAIEVPALVVVGDEDAFTSRADADSMHSLLKNSELVWMAGVGHMPNLENPDEFNAGLNRLLARVGRVSRS